jgi:AcrR family transcriptional regulator
VVIRYAAVPPWCGVLASKRNGNANAERKAQQAPQLGAAREVITAARAAQSRSDQERSARRAEQQGLPQPARAGVASGLFYRYFRDLGDVVAEVCATFFDELIEQTGALADFSDPYDWIYDNHRTVVTLFAKNPGILACLFGIAGHYPEFDAIWKRNAHVWNLQVAKFLQTSAGFAPRSAERMGFVLGAMTEGVVYQELIRRTEDLAQLGRRPEDIAEVIAVMWYRTIFLRNPPAEKLHAPGRALTALAAGR